MNDPKPIFLLTKFRNLSKENEKDWINVIQSTKSPKKEKTISAYLKWNLKKEAFQHLAENVVDNFLLKKFRSFLLENEKVIQSAKSPSNREIVVIKHLKYFLHAQKKRFLSDSDLPCYTSPAVQDDLRKRIKVICTNDMPHIEAACIDHAEVIKSWPL